MNKERSYLKTEFDREEFIKWLYQKMGMQSEYERLQIIKQILKSSPKRLRRKDIEMSSNCEKCGHDIWIWHFGRLGQIVCLKCNNCFRDQITGKWLE